jgi:hypothetical protein
MKVSLGMCLIVGVLAFCMVMEGVVAPFPKDDPRYTLRAVYKSCKAHRRNVVCLGITPGVGYTGVILGFPMGNGALAQTPAFKTLIIVFGCFSYNFFSTKCPLMEKFLRTPMGVILWGKGIKNFQSYVT